METLLIEPINLEELADACAIGITRKPPKPRDRSKFHVSNLLASAELIVKGKVEYYEGNDEPSGIMSMGRVWEAAVDCYLLSDSKLVNWDYTPDVEIEEDGIIASLDGVEVDRKTGLISVVETKLRFTQNMEIPPKHLQQIRAYCHVLGARGAIYVTGHVGSAPPTFAGYLRFLQCTAQEIADTWKGIVATKDYLIRQGCLPQGVRK